MGQPELAEAARIEYGTLKAYLRHGGSGSPDMDQLLAIGRASGVPDAFMLYGWEQLDRLAHLERRVGEDAERYEGALAELRAALGEITPDALRDELEAELEQRVQEEQRAGRPASADAPSTPGQGRPRTAR